MQGARRWQPTPIILATGEAEIGGSQFEASPTSKIPNTKQGWWNGSSSKAPEFKPQYCDPLPKKKTMQGIPLLMWEWAKRNVCTIDCLMILGCEWWKPGAGLVMQPKSQQSQHSGGGGKRITSSVQPGLQRKFQASLSYIARPCLKNTE
jgi:hypothetical protein